MMDFLQVQVQVHHRGLASNNFESWLAVQGYPRSDVDIAAVRGDRHTVITLTNDHKALTRDIDLLLVRLHALAR